MNHICNTKLSYLFEGIYRLSDLSVCIRSRLCQIVADLCALHDVYSICVLCIVSFANREVKKYLLLIAAVFSSFAFFFSDLSGFSGLSGMSSPFFSASSRSAAFLYFFADFRILFFFAGASEFPSVGSAETLGGC